MDEIINKFLLAGDKFIPEMHLRQPGFTYSACGPFTKNKERIKSLKKQENQDIFIKTNYIKLVFNTMWLMEILKIELDEQLLIKYYMIKHLILLKIQNMMDINVDLLQWSINFLIKKLLALVLKIIMFQTNKQLANKLDKPITKKFNKKKVDKGSELYNRSMKLFLQNNDIEMYSTQNEGKSVVAERFIRTLRKKNL